MKDIIFPITYKNDEKGLNQAKNSLGKLGKVVAGIGIAAAAAAGAAGVALLTKSLTSGFDRLVSIENATNQLSALGHSAAEVEGIMNSALESVKGTAFGLGDAAKIAASAVAAGVKPGQDLTKFLTLTADAAAVAGVSLDQMGNNMNKVRTIGAAYNDSLLVIAEKGLPIYTTLADQLGITTEQVRKMASQGQISAEIFETAMETMVGGAALKAGETVEGSIANMEAAFARLGAALLGTTFEELPGVFTQITEALDAMLPEFEAIGAQVGPVLVDTFKDLIKAVLPLISPLMQIIAAILPPLASLIAAVAPIVVRLIEALLPLVAKVLPVLVNLFEKLLPPLLLVLDAALTPLISIIDLLVDVLSPMIDAVLPIFIMLFELTATILTSVMDAILPLLEKAMKPLAKIVEALVPVIVAWVEAVQPLYETLFPLVIKIIERLLEVGLDPLFAIIEQLVPVIEFLAKAFETFINDFIKPAIKAIKDFVQALKDLFSFDKKELVIRSRVTGPATSAVSALGIQAGRAQGMAKGGVASLGGMSWVGEKGPELLTMPRGATVTPIPQHMRADALMGANRGGGQGGNHITINVNGGLDSSAQIGEAVVNAIRKYERTSGAVFVRA